MPGFGRKPLACKNWRKLAESLIEKVTSVCGTPHPSCENWLCPLVRFICAAVWVRSRNLLPVKSLASMNTKPLQFSSAVNQPRTSPTAETIPPSSLTTAPAAANTPPVTTPNALPTSSAEAPETFKNSAVCSSSSVEPRLVTEATARTASSGPTSIGPISQELVRRTAPLPSLRRSPAGPGPIKNVSKSRLVIGPLISIGLMSFTLTAKYSQSASFSSASLL